MKIIMAAIKNVAKLAGISPSTTSCALYDMISQTTKERVRQAMKELNYSPNYSGSNVVKKQTNTVGINLPVRKNQEI